MTYGVLTGRFAQRLATWGIGNESGYAGGKSLRHVGDPRVVAMLRPRPADPEEADTTTRPIAIATSTLMFVPSKTVVGTQHQVGFYIEGAHIGDEAQQTDAFIDRGLGQAGRSAPVG